MAGRRRKARFTTRSTHAGNPARVHDAPGAARHIRYRGVWEFQPPFLLTATLSPALQALNCTVFGEDFGWRFASRGDLDAAHCTIEEREEYEPHLAAGNTIYAGVDYADVLKRAEAESDLILWDGGNNDFPSARTCTSCWPTRLRCRPRACCPDWREAMSRNGCGTGRACRILYR